MYRHYSYFLLIVFLLSPICFAGTDDYQAELGELKSLLTQWKDSDAPANLKEPMASMGEALVALLEADDCFTISDYDIMEIADFLSYLGDRLSYPCESLSSEAADLAHDIGRLGYNLAFEAEAADLGLLRTKVITQWPLMEIDYRNDLVRNDPEKNTCTVTILVLRPPGFFYPLAGQILNSSNKREEHHFLAIGEPSGGTFEWTPSTSTRLKDEWVNVNPSASGVTMRLDSSEDRALYVTKARVTYTAPDGLVCDASASVIIQP